MSLMCGSTIVQYEGRTIVEKSPLPRDCAEYILTSLRLDTSNAEHRQLGCLLNTLILQVPAIGWRKISRPSKLLPSAK